MTMLPLPNRALLLFSCQNVLGFKQRVLVVLYAESHPSQPSKPVSSPKRPGGDESALNWFTDHPYSFQFINTDSTIFSALENACRWIWVPRNYSWRSGSCVNNKGTRDPFIIIWYKGVQCGLSLCLVSCDVDCHLCVNVISVHVHSSQELYLPGGPEGSSSSLSWLELGRVLILFVVLVREMYIINTIHSTSYIALLIS